MKLYVKNQRGSIIKIYILELIFNNIYFRILKDHTNSSDMQSQAFETLKEKLNDLEVQLQREKSAFFEAQV